MNGRHTKEVFDRKLAAMGATMDIDPSVNVTLDAGVTDIASRVGSINFAQATDANEPALSGGNRTENQLLYSEDLGNAENTGVNVVLTSGAVAGPFGRSVYKMASSTATGQHYIYQANNLYVVSGVGYRLGAVVKQAGRTDIRLLFFTTYFPASNSVDFELDTGANSGVNTNTDAVGMEDLGDGWYHCWIDVTASSSNTLNGFALQNLPDSHTGNGTDGIYIAGYYIQTVDMQPKYVQTAAKPIYGSNTGRRGIYFDGGAKVMAATETLDDVFNAGGKTALVVATPRQIAQSNGSFFSDSSLFFRMAANSGSIRTQNFETAYDTLDQTVANGQAWVAAYTHDGTNHTVDSNIAKGTTGASGATDDVTNALQLGLSSGAFRGSLYRLVTFDRALPDSVVGVLQRDLEKAYNVN